MTASAQRLYAEGFLEVQGQLSQLIINLCVSTGLWNGGRAMNAVI